MKTIESVLKKLTRDEYCEANVAQAWQEILEIVKGCVPCESAEYTPPSFTSSAKHFTKDFVDGFNSCRQDILTKLEEI